MYGLNKIRASKPQALLGDEDGAALLELTVIMPFLIVLGLGLFEFSNMLYQYHLITGGVRDAGRFAAGLPKPDPLVQDEECTDPAATPVGCAKRLALTGQIASVGIKRVDWWDADSITITYPLVTNTELGSGLESYRGGSSIFMVRVSTTVAYDDIGFLDALGLGPITIATAHEERHYGVR